MDETITKLRILASAEINLARINAQRLANRGKLMALAIGLVLLAVVMFNVGAFELIGETYGDAAAAFIVAGANLVLAILLLITARQLQPGPEEQIVREIRELALAELTADVDQVKQEVTQFSADVKRLRKGFSAFSGGGGVGLGLTSLAPVLTMIIEALKSKK